MQLTDPEKRVLYHNYYTGHTQYTLPGSGADQGPKSAEGDKGVAPLGQRSSAPLGAKLQSEDSVSSVLGHRLSGPAAFHGSLNQRMNGSEALAASSDAHASSVEPNFSNLRQRMPEAELKIGQLLYVKLILDIVEHRTILVPLPHSSLSIAPAAAAH